jgi:hypothetical protein
VSVDISPAGHCKVLVRATLVTPLVGMALQGKQPFLASHKFPLPQSLFLEVITGIGNCDKAGSAYE